MEKNEYLKLLNIEVPFVGLITVDNLKNKKDRTLLYGYDCDRNTFHVYLKNEKIHILRYNSSGIFTKLEAFSNYDYVPNKRVYPEYSDFEFCKLLLEQEVEIPFLQFRNDMPNVQSSSTYFGKTL